MNIRNTNIHKAADFIRVGGDVEGYRRLVRGWATPDVHNEPGIRDLGVPGRALAVASAENAATKNLFVEISRSIDVGDNDKLCNGESAGRGILYDSGSFVFITAAD